MRADGVWEKERRGWDGRDAKRGRGMGMARVTSLIRSSRWTGIRVTSLNAKLQRYMRIPPFQQVDDTGST